MKNKMINKEFFNRNPEIVACELLGKILIRKINKKELKAKIVETEAYFDENDPASRARQNGDLRETMKMAGGTILVYGVHNNWLINFVTGCEGKAEAVLIRAVEPLNFKEKGNGPGLLTKALKIDKKFHKQNIFGNKELWVEDSDADNFVNINNQRGYAEEIQFNKNQETNKKIKDKSFEIVESFRIGVKKDLERPLRFYIKNNKWVSRI